MNRLKNPILKRDRRILEQALEILQQLRPGFEADRKAAKAQHLAKPCDASKRIQWLAQDRLEALVQARKHLNDLLVL